MWKSHIAGFVVLLALTTSHAALGDMCPTGPNVIYAAGSTAVGPLINAIGPRALNEGITIVYKGKSSCEGVGYMIGNPDGTRPCTEGICVAGTETVVFTPGSQTPVSCTVPTGGVAADVALSDIYATTCEPVQLLPQGVVDVPGPVNAFVFVVPKLSSQTALTAEQGYFVFGWPLGDGRAGPWDTKFIRSSNSGTQQLMSRAIRLESGGAMKGESIDTSDLVADRLAAQTTLNAAERSIGILGADTYEVRRSRSDDLKALAFKARNQQFAYYPDSSSTAKDKQNVRDGHYAIWGYVHLLGATEADGVTPKGKFAQFVNLVNVGITAGPNAYDAIDPQIESGLVPTCAMRVTRSAEMGPLSPLSPAAPCSCYFEQKTKGSTSCQSCASSPCASGVCRRGFCEAR